MPAPDRKGSLRFSCYPVVTVVGRQLIELEVLLLFSSLDHDYLGVWVRQASSASTGSSSHYSMHFAHSQAEHMTTG